MAGYSKKTLVEKLGIKEHMRIAILNKPNDYEKTLGELPVGVVIDDKLNKTYPFIQFFTQSQEALKEKFLELKHALEKNGMLWISWPKGACNIRTDLNENIIRDIGLKHGLVDVKVIAVDDVWAGLKFVYRLKDR